MMCYRSRPAKFTPQPITTLIGWEDAHKSWDSGRPLPKAILNGGIRYMSHLVKV